MTEKAHRLKKVLEETPSIGVEELVKMGVIPEEKPYLVSNDLREAR